MANEDVRVMDALSALAAACTWSQYNAAKRLAAKCDRISQMAMVDSLKEARDRVLGLSSGSTEGGHRAR